MIKNGSGPLLSICIPTRNRAGALQMTLESIVSQTPFQETDDVEIVVSDNCSEDETPLVVSLFQAKFPSKISYSRNDLNIADQNFEHVLSLANGTFLKLNNDTLAWRDGSLSEVIKILQVTSAERPLLFFLNGNPCCPDQIRSVVGLSEFIQSASFNITWIGSFGIWRDDFRGFTDFSRHSDLQLVQTDVLLRAFSTGRRGVVVNLPFFISATVGKKGGYNIAEIFGRNYLSLLKGYLRDGLLDLQIFEAEKKALLLKHIIPYYFNLREEHDFDSTGFFCHLQDYWTDAYFYEEVEPFLEFPALQENAPARDSEPPPSIPAPANLGELWRHLNQHNDTYLTRAVDISRISVGRKTYGPLAVWTWHHPDERLTIGNFVSIGEGVKFLLGGNHPYSGFSTFPFTVKYFGQSEEAQTKGPTVIEDDVWIGADALILSGLTIGKGAVIAAGSVITKTVPPYSVVGGNPARVLKFRFEPTIIQELLKFDFSKLTDEQIVRNHSILYEQLTAENIKDVLSRLTD